MPAFDAAARLLSFTKAAVEINVTHGAINWAGRHLEEVPGVRLFERGTRSVRLTAEGATYASEALDRIGVATMATGASKSPGVLDVSTSDGFAGRWLVPRLYRFHRSHPEIDVRLSTTGMLTDFIRDGIDIAIRYGEGYCDKAAFELLMDEDVLPVCSPELRQHRLVYPEAALRYRKIRAFRDWLFSETAADAQRLESLADGTAVDRAAFAN